MINHKTINNTRERIGGFAAKFFILNSSFFILAGCATHARLDNSARLIARPDFPAARAAAPEWCRDALKTVNALELDIERR